MQEAVVFVHGIWMKGYEMSLLRRRITKEGYRCYQFSYASLWRSPCKNAARLNRFIQQEVDADVVHIVAHSLGGIVVAHLFEAYPQQKPGRIVLLGSPLRGSALAQWMYKSVLTRGLLGAATQRGLLGDAPPLKCQRDIGMIAGTRGIGMGTVFMLGRLDQPNDGTVSVKETDVATLKEHLQVPYSHFAMMWSSAVAHAVISFIRHGRFDR